MERENHRVIRWVLSPRDPVVSVFHLGGAAGTSLDEDGKM